MGIRSPPQKGGGGKPLVNKLSQWTLGWDRAKLATGIPNPSMAVLGPRWLYEAEELRSRMMVRTYLKNILMMTKTETYSRKFLKMVMIYLKAFLMMLKTYLRKLVMIVKTYLKKFPIMLET